MAEVLQRSLDERRRPKNRRVILHLVHGGRKIRHRLFYFAGYVQGVGPRLFLDNQQEPWSIVDNRIPNRRCMIDRHRGDVSNAKRCSIGLHSNWLGLDRLR